jgi:hypothetical protein
MPQLSISISSEDLDLLKKTAESEALRPLTLASSLLTTALRGQTMAMKEWFNFKAALNTSRAQAGKVPIGWKPDEIEKEFGPSKETGDGPDIDEQLRALAPVVDITKGRGIK